MTDEKSLRDALRTEADHEPLATDAWAQVATALRDDERRRFRVRVAAGAGAVVLAAAAAVSIGLVIVNEDGTDVVTNPGSTVPTTPVTTPAPGTTAPPSPDTTVGSDTTAGTETTVVGTAPESAPTAPIVTTVAPEPPAADPILAVRDDGRIVTLSPTDGSEIVQLGAVQTAEHSTGIGVSQANGVGYYSGPFENTGRIWKVPVAGGAPEQIAFGSYPAISPDGTTLAYVEPPRTIVLFDVATNQQLSSTTWDPNDPDFFHLGGSITRLEWSPDGTALVLQTNYEGSEVLVFRPGTDATLSAGDPAGGVSSPTWAGNDRIESIHVCCYPEDLEPREVRTYELGSDQPVTSEPRVVVVIDRRPDGTRSAEINIDDPSSTFSDAGTLSLRDATGAIVWQTTDQYRAVSV